MIKKQILSLFASSGLIALAMFWLAIISGIGLVTLFDILNPMESLKTIQTQNPFGVFFHSLHYWSAQFCLIFTIIHLIQKLKSPSLINSRAWIYATFSIPLLFLIMITGYIIKGDMHGALAYNILLNCLNSIPGLGYVFTRMFTMPSTSLLSIYIYHASILSIGFILTIYLHSKKLFTSDKEIIYSWVPIIALSFLLPPIIISNPESIQRAPWYLLSLQEAMHWITIPWILIFNIAIFGLILLFFPKYPTRMKKVFRRIVIGFVFLNILIYLFVANFRSYQWKINYNKAIRSEKLFFSPTIFWDIDKY